MRFIGAFVCSKCSKEFTIDLGPQWMAEHRMAKKIGKTIGELAAMFAGSCIDHESICEAKGASDSSEVP